MAVKKRKKSNSEDEEVEQDGTPELEPVVEQEVEQEPDGDGDSGEPAATYVMGKIYVAGVDDEEEESDGPVNVDEYEEMDDSPELKKARELITGNGTDDDAAMSTAEEDPFLEKVDYDPSEEWALGD